MTGDEKRAAIINAVAIMAASPANQAPVEDLVKKAIAIFDETDKRLTAAETAVV